MQLHIQQTPWHTTFDNHRATYAVVRDALTAKRVAMFQVVDLGEGVTQYRTMDRRTMPPDFTFDEAIRLAMVDETKRRAKRPPRRPHWTDIQPRPHPGTRFIRPMQLPPERGFRPVPPNARPMRRRLCEKLAERHAAKAVAS